MMILFFMLTVTMMSTIHATNFSLLTQQNPFTYNLGVKIIPSKNTNSEVTICCHGYGHNNQIVDVVHSFNILPGTLIGFNFPDYNITPARDHHKVAYGTIHEILPLLYIIKRCIIDLQLPKINLYGFSAGGGAIINALAVLHHTTYEKELQTIGITNHEKTKILAALTRGLIILDCPLKSFGEIYTEHIPTSEFKILATNYTKNNMNPLDTISLLSGMQLTILLHFQKPDEILGNRDDALFIERLRKANKGTTTVVIGNDGGHNSMHTSLWNQYKKLMQK